MYIRQLASAGIVSLSKLEQLSPLEIEQELPQFTILCNLPYIKHLLFARCRKIDFSFNRKRVSCYLQIVQRRPPFGMNVKNRLAQIPLFDLQVQLLGNLKILISYQFVFNLYKHKFITYIRGHLLGWCAGNHSEISEFRVTGVCVVLCE